METKERLEYIEDKLSECKKLYEQLLPIWNMIDRKKQTLELEIKNLRDQRNEVGQLTFDDEF